MRPEIIYVVGQLSAGGQERQLCWLLQGLLSRGLSPAVVVWNDDKAAEFRSLFEKLGLPLVGFPPGLSSSVKLHSLRGLVRGWNANLVHSYSFFTNFAAAFAAGGRSLAVGSIRSDFWFDRVRSGPVVGRLSARWPRVAVCNSETAAENVRCHGGFFRPQQCYVVRNGINLACFFPEIPPPAVPHIVGFGRLDPVKRWDILIKAADLLRHQGRTVRVTIAGAGPLRDILAEDLNRRGLKGIVDLAGYRSDVAGLLSRATALALTSDTEGCPNVVMEAMAAGRPVVATSVGDVPRLIDDGLTGCLVERGDAAALAERLGRLAANPEEVRRLGMAGRAKADREFGLERMVNATMMAYRSAGWKG